MILEAANHFKTFLPIYLPFTFALLSIIAGIATGRITLSTTELLKVHGDMILGLFSFVTWGLVTYFQSGRVDLNAQSFIDITHAFFLLILTFALLLFSIISIRHKWVNEYTFGKFRFTSNMQQNSANGFVLLISCVFALFPFYLQQNISSAPQDSIKAHDFRVVIPFTDKSLISHVGEYRWRSRTLCAIEDVTSNSEAEAKNIALEKFQRSELYKPILPTSRQRVGREEAADSPITIDENRIAIAKSRI